MVKVLHRHDGMVSMRSCIACKRMVQKLFKCKTCIEKYGLVAHYCSKQCQQQDWAKHKKVHAALIDRTSARPAFIEKDDGRYYLRLASVQIPAGAEITDANSIPFTEAYIVNARVANTIQPTYTLNPQFIHYGPLPLAPGARPMEGMQFSDDMEDQNISHLKVMLIAPSCPQRCCAPLASGE